MTTRRDESSEDARNSLSLGFPATRWTLIGRAGGPTTMDKPAAIAEIARLYSPALRSHLLQTLRYDEHRADDLLQSFLAVKVLEQRLIGHADPDRGRFRTFLLAALDRFMIDELRREKASKRSPARALGDIDDHRESLAAAGASRSDAFDLAWARQVLSDVLSNMRGECEHSKRSDLWDIFEVRYLMPAIDNVPPETHESIAQRLNLTSPADAANLLITAKRMFTRNFKAIVSRYAASEAEVREEVADLWRIFSTANNRA